MRGKRGRCVGGKGEGENICTKGYGQNSHDGMKECRGWKRQRDLNRT